MVKMSELIKSRRDNKQRCHLDQLQVLLLPAYWRLLRLKKNRFASIYWKKYILGKWDWEKSFWTKRLWEKRIGKIVLQSYLRIFSTWVLYYTLLFFAFLLNLSNFLARHCLWIDGPAIWISVSFWSFTRYNCLAAPSSRKQITCRLRELNCGFQVLL